MTCLSLILLVLVKCFGNFQNMKLTRRYLNVQPEFELHHTEKGPLFICRQYILQSDQLVAKINEKFPSNVFQLKRK
jgi:hypothetical protein